MHKLKVRKNVPQKNAKPPQKIMAHLLPLHSNFILFQTLLETMIYKLYLSSNRVK